MSNLEFLHISTHEFPRWEDREPVAALLLATPSGRIREVFMTEEELMTVVRDALIQLNRMRIKRDDNAPKKSYDKP